MAAPQRIGWKSLMPSLGCSARISAGAADAARGPNLWSAGVELEDDLREHDLRAASVDVGGEHSQGGDGGDHHPRI
jgi:hypothetical protein